MPRNKPMIPKRVDSARAAEEAHYREELAHRQWMGRYAQEHGLQMDGGHELPEPGSEDAVAHLKQLPPELAVQKAREWTGDDTISTPEEAVAAVRAALGGE